MQKKKNAIIALLLVISIVNYSRLADNENLRAIQFVSIFVMGALTALLINNLVGLFRVNEK